MIITIQNKEGDFSQYDVEKISDVQSRLNAKTRISKVGTLDVVAEALSFASSAHRAELESILIGCLEAKVEITKEEAYDYGWDLAADFPSLNNIDVAVTVKNGEWLIEVQYYYEIDEVEESPSAEEEDEQIP